MKTHTGHIEYSREEKEELQKERRFRFDGRITLGNLISILTFVGAMFAAWRNMESRLLLVEERVRSQTATVERIEKKLDTMVAFRPHPFNNP